jgi:hypothetical protein
MPRYDDTFVDRFLEPWNRHDVDGALALMTDDCVWATMSENGEISDDDVRNWPE